MADESGFHVGQRVRVGSHGAGEIAEVRPGGKLLVKITFSTGVLYTGKTDDLPQANYKEFDADKVQPAD
jgi:hypothetical protein